jgi:23S rRNA (pseudouridine1915-N3)-methyltransferase
VQPDRRLHWRATDNPRRRTVRLLILTLSHRQPAWVDAGFAEYARRMPREVRLELTELRPEPRPDNAGPAAVARLLEREAERLAAAIPRGALKVVLDERGSALTTRQLAGHLERWLGEGRDAAFLVGSADGLAPSIREGADAVLSLSALTLPHGLVRVLLAEQLYRAFSLLHNHPYHRD